MTDERDEFPGILGPTTQNLRTGGKVHAPGEWHDEPSFDDLIVPPGCLDIRSGDINPVSPGFMTPGFSSISRLGIRTQLEDSWLWAVSLIRFKEEEGDTPGIDEDHGEHIVSRTFLGATKKAQTMVNQLNAQITDNHPEVIWEIQNVTHVFKVKL